MRTIPLSRGQVAIVDDADYEWLSQWKWYALWAPGTKSFYAMRKTSRAKGQVRHVIQMHRLILGLERGDPRQGDHKEAGCTLDNRRTNLRIATVSQNAANKRRQKSNAGLKGVWFDPRRGKWRAQLEKHSRHVYLGHHNTPEAAHAAYIAGAKEHFGEFARVA